MRQALRLWRVHMQEKEKKKIMKTENNTTGRALWRTGLRVLALAFGALGWVLSTLSEVEKRRSEEEDDLPWFDPGKVASEHAARYSESGRRLW